MKTVYFDSKNCPGCNKPLKLAGTVATFLTEHPEALSISYLLCPKCSAAIKKGHTARIAANAEKVIYAQIRKQGEQTWH